ncbi:hypothetical protein F2Q69_00043634 [Brassica cretica]|uniref:Uncharacterized protein n=1 Tax=Brassica cretica TaxID=69181 RepID=A0A8S9ND92_BRACR|nr:hypothetical protein F2Q69_00043634 [Brassica cretica]
MGVDELEQLELQVDTSVRKIRSTTVSKMHTICQIPQIVEFLGTGDIVRIETTNGWCLPIVEFLGTGEVVRIETTNWWCLPVDSLPSHVHCAITPAQLGLSVYQTLGSKLTTTKQYQRCYAAEDNNITDDLEVTLTIMYYNQNATTRLDADLIITDLE